MSSLDDLKPQMLWKVFAGLCAIPHPSGSEAGVREYLKRLAENSGLKTEVDSVGNLIIVKTASPGRETAKTVILQGHMDMVPQKNSDIAFDFKENPIVAVIDGDEVHTDGKTTLGADNGIGIAAAMDMLLSGDVSHGPLKALFTVEEETGLNGAMGVQADMLAGDILLNLDSEDDGQIFVGCAGGARLRCDFDIPWRDAVPGFSGLKINISGLCGGHSGCDINKGRGNANKILSLLLEMLSNEYGIQVSRVEGGTLDNAIPREAFAVVAVPGEICGSAIIAAEDFASQIKDELGDSDPGFKLEVIPCEMPEIVWEEAFQRKVLKALNTCPNGVMAMSKTMSGLVETSTNLAALETDDEKLKIKLSQRSSIDSEREALTNKIIALFDEAGAKCRVDNQYPGWEPDLGSGILRIVTGKFEELFDYQPEVVAIHAGLECGILGAKNPALDMVSFGPDIRNPHSPSESVSISSVARFRKLLKAVIEAV
jgi:dipeptidase D